SLLPQTVDPVQLTVKPDSFYLEEMTRSIFQSGFVWRVINNKWPTFRQAFFDFDISKLMRLSEDDWDDYIHDTRIVRHRQKIQALRHNLWFVNDTAGLHHGFGQFLVDWPKSDLVGLFRYLKTKGSRLGGNTGQYFLQHVGVDSFALTRDVVLCLQMSGLDIRNQPSSQKDLKLIQQTFNQWHEETGYSYLNLSMIMAYSVGENRVQVDAV
ncbi:MAG: DNA-3-methyladenine glycosylase I, partial [Gammaproteobacteria bacterium]|nr:DNA-3-methyladenine glycosylase I [Gammaproteobacteria bacterium]